MYCGIIIGMADNKSINNTTGDPYQVPIRKSPIVIIKQLQPTKNNATKDGEVRGLLKTLSTTEKQDHPLYQELLTDLMNGDEPEVIRKIKESFTKNGGYFGDDADHLRMTAADYMNGALQLPDNQRGMFIRLLNLLYDDHPAYEELLGYMLSGDVEKAKAKIKELPPTGQLTDNFLLGATSERRAREICPEPEASARKILDELIWEHARVYA
jgi:hypothetical protein